MDGERRGVLLYGFGADAVAEALRQLDPRYFPADDLPPRLGQVPVLCRSDGYEADAARETMSVVTWLVVELYRPEEELRHARDPVLHLNTSKVDPRTAARAIDQADLVIWYEVIDPIRATTVGGGPTANDYSNLAFVVPEGYRMVAHAVEGGTAPECLPRATELVLRSHDLWALARLREIEICQECTLRHG